MNRRKRLTIKNKKVEFIIEMFEGKSIYCCFCDDNINMSIYKDIYGCLYRVKDEEVFIQ